MNRKQIHIIALNGRPKNGNTATLMNWVIKGCSLEGAKVEWINIIDQDISYCLGCHNCLRTNEYIIQMVLVYNSVN